MRGFLTGVAAMVIIAGGAAIFFETFADYSASQVYTSQGSVRLDGQARR